MFALRSLETSWFLTLPKIRRTNRPPLPTNPEPLSPGAGWGFNFQNLPSTHVEEPPTAPAIPASLLSRSKRAFSNGSGVSHSTKYTTPSQTPSHMSGLGGRNRRPPSVTSSDEEVSSDMSSENSLSTPPAQPRRLLTPIYGPGTGRTAPVSLPTQAPGTGRAGLGLFPTVFHEAPLSHNYLPRAPAMAARSQRPQGRGGVLSALNMTIDALNLAREVSSIAPAKRAFGSVNALLAVTRVRFTLLL